MASHTNEFSECPKPATLSVEQVQKAARWTRQANSRGKQTRNSELDGKVWEETKKEISKGWISGPFSEMRLSEVLGPLFV
eukprot:12085618-Karenia_brevis.AAC.1